MSANIDHRNRRRLGPAALAAAGVLLLGGLAAAVAVKPAAKPKPQSKARPGAISIYYTSDAFGQIRSCNCSKFRFGGYAREATALVGIRKQSGNMVLVEGGDFLGVPDSPQDRLKAEVTAQCFKALGYNAVVVGESDLRFGAAKLRSYETMAGVPFLAANLREKATNQPLFTKQFAVVTTTSGYRVAIIGLFDPALVPMNLIDRPDFIAADPVATLKQILPKAKANADFVMVVAHTTYERGKVMAKVAGVDALMMAHREAESTIMPPNDGDTISAPVENVGKCVMVKSHTRTGWNLGRLDIDLASGTRTAKNSLTFLNRHFEESPRIITIYETYNKNVKDMVMLQQKRMKEQVVAQLISHGVDPKRFQRPKVFLTSEGCKSCHESAYETWKKSRHATAFASLTGRHQDFDPECTICHTTGSAVRGGFSDAKATSDLTNVQCEACHGPGVGHAAKPEKGYGATGEENCRACHTEEYNPNFDYDQMWKIVAH